MAEVKTDAFTPQEVTEKVLGLSVAKTSMPLRTQLPLAFMAGVYISLGALFSYLLSGDSTLPYALQRFGAGAVFSLGLSLVLIAGAELYTGNTMVAGGAVDGRISWGATLGNWVRVWLGNCLGALSIVAAVYFAHVADNPHFAKAIVATAQGKLALDWGTIFVKGILCNLFVCLGVWVGYAGRTVTDKVLGVLLPVSAFVAVGFEHCVANMFFLPMAFLVYSSGGFDPALADVFTAANLFKNLSAATLGNTAAGMMLIIIYRTAFKK